MTSQDPLDLKSANEGEDVVTDEVLQSALKLLIVVPPSDRGLGEFLQDHLLQSEIDVQLWAGEASDFKPDEINADVCLLAISENRSLNESWLIPIAPTIGGSSLELCAYVKTHRQYEIVSQESQRTAEIVNAGAVGVDLEKIKSAVEKSKDKVTQRRKLIAEALEWDKLGRPPELLSKLWQQPDAKIPGEQALIVADFNTSGSWYSRYLRLKARADQWHSEGRPDALLADASEIHSLTELGNAIPRGMSVEIIVEDFIKDSIRVARPSPAPKFDSEIRYSRVRTDAEANPLKSIPPLAKPKQPRVRNSVLDCSVFSPPTAFPESTILIQVTLHAPEQFEEANARAVTIDSSATLRNTTTLEMKIPIDTRLDIFLEGASGLEVENPVQSATWRGRTLTVNFAAKTPRSAGTLFPKLRLSCNGAIVAEIRFKLDVIRETPKEPADQSLVIKPYRRVFFSYSSEDRVRVLETAQSYRALGVEFFQDILDLGPGQRWEQRLYREIDTCDLFLLFWSRSASSSEWVAKEASYALDQQRKSVNRKPEIIPLILDGPPPPSPPEFLQHLHFNDWMRYAIAAAEVHK